MPSRVADGPKLRAGGMQFFANSLVLLALLCAEAATLASPADAAFNDCGQPVSDGATPTASDALFILGAAVGTQTCDPCVCDTNASGGITAGDALATLAAAVGGQGVLSCEPCNDERASCWFDIVVGGDTAAEFDGPAQFEVAGDGTVTFTLRSRGYINDDTVSSVIATFTTAPGNPLAPGTYDIASAGINFVDPPYTAYYFPGVPGSDCGTCGGSVTFDSIVDEQSISGNANVEMVRVLPPPQGGELPPVRMNVEFHAAFGSQFDGGSPYVQCSIEY